MTSRDLRGPPYDVDTSCSITSAGAFPKGTHDQIIVSISVNVSTSQVLPSRYTPALWLKTCYHQIHRIYLYIRHVFALAQILHL